MTSALSKVESMSKMKSFSGIWKCEANEVGYHWTINIEKRRCLCNMSMGKMATGFSLLDASLEGWMF